MTIYTLTPKEFLIEKIDTYLNRTKIRDLYDVFFLLRFIDDKNPIRDKLKKLIKDFKKPYDENDLKILILTGLVPSSDNMINYIRTYA